jgi:hypothetical protein
MKKSITVFTVLLALSYALFAVAQQFSFEGLIDPYGLNEWKIVYAGATPEGTVAVFENPDPKAEVQYVLTLSVGDREFLKSYAYVCKGEFHRFGINEEGTGYREFNTEPEDAEFMKDFIKLVISEDYI